jgi:hypothetical protein
MGFSITGNLLPGSMQRPDNVLFVFKKNINQSSSTNTVSNWNIAGYLPVVSTISGLSRALLGLVHTIGHLACSIFSKNKEHHLQEAKLGAKNIKRGLIETFPIIGNITLFINDQIRLGKYEKMADQQIKNNTNAYINHAIMFTYGKEIAKRPLDEYIAELNTLKGSPSVDDMIRITQNQAKLVGQQIIVQTIRGFPWIGIKFLFAIYHALARDRVYVCCTS